MMPALDLRWRQGLRPPARCYLDSLENRIGVATELSREIYKPSD